MSYSSVVTEFINTGPSSKRTKIVKSSNKLRSLDGNSIDIFEHGSIDRYTVRPDSLKNVTLADFVSEYNFKSSKNTPINNEVDDEIHDEDME